MVKWTQGKFNNHIAKLGPGLTLTIHCSVDAEFVRRDFRWCPTVFGVALEPCRELVNAKEAAEDKAREVLNEALAVIEGEKIP